ncbi:MAG: hypothetical protein GX130_02530 [Candidatus Hydrogenedens sp.]|nr:hypothetical protein [Candidatus Hydrogenedens sp.]
MTKTRYLFLLIALLLMVGTFSGCQQGFLTGKWEGSIYTNGKEGVTHEVREFFPNNTFVWITDTTILGFTGRLKIAGTYKVKRNFQAPGHVDFKITSINDQDLGKRSYSNYGVFKMSGFLWTRKLHLNSGSNNLNRPPLERLDPLKGPVFVGKRKVGGLIADMF